MAAPTSQSPIPCLVDPFPSVSTHYPDLPGGPRRPPLLPTAAPQTPSSDPDLPSPTGSGAQLPPDSLPAGRRPARACATAHTRLPEERGCQSKSTRRAGALLCASPRQTGSGATEFHEHHTLLPRGLRWAHRTGQIGAAEGTSGADERPSAAAHAAEGPRKTPRLDVSMWMRGQEEDRDPPPATPTEWARAWRGRPGGVLSCAWPFAWGGSSRRW